MKSTDSVSTPPHWPLVSVGLPTYNRSAALKQAIDSVLAQDYPNIELLISDNASIDETEALCRDLCAHDSRVKYFRQLTNRGPSLNFREVLLRASGEFFMWLGDDDWLDEGYIARCMEVLLERPDHSLVCGISRYFQDGQLLFEGENINLSEESKAERMKSYYRQVKHNGAFYGVIRRQQLDFSLPLNTLGGDWLLIATVAYHGKLATLPEISVCRARGGLSRSTKNITRELGISELYGWFPNASIGIAALKDVAWRSDAFNALSLRERFTLALEVFSVFWDRWFYPYWYDLLYPMRPHLIFLVRFKNRFFRTNRIG